MVLKNQLIKVKNNQGNSNKYKSLKNASILIQAFMDYGSIICTT